MAIPYPKLVDPFNQKLTGYKSYTFSKIKRHKDDYDQSIVRREAADGFQGFLLSETPQVSHIDV